jgi:Zn-dependent protease with chaperone function
MASLTVVEGLHSFEYEHPFDAKALDALRNTAGFDAVVRQFNKHLIERLITVQYTGSNLKITNQNYPKMYALLDNACEILNLQQRPDLYLQPHFGINGFTVGSERPIIVISSEAIDLLDELELLYVLGHEIGHVKSQHVLYHQIASYLPALAEAIGNATLGIGGLLSIPIQMALYNWSRMSEFTADRAGLLACQDVEVAGRVMMKIAGMPTKYYNELDFEVFLQQAKEFEELDYDTMNKAMKLLLAMDQSHPWTVMRTAQLFRWIESGEYESVLERKTKDRINKKTVGNRIVCRRCGYFLNGTENFCPNCQLQLQEISPPQH